MENPRPEKVAVVDEVRAKLEAADAAVLTEYRGLNVSATAELRSALRDAGGEYKIYKNTLVRFAARDLGLEIDDLLTGPTAIAFVDGDPVNVAKALRDFAKTNPALVIKGGLLGDQLVSRGRRQGPGRRRAPRGAAGQVRRPARCPDAAVRRPARRPCPATSPTASRPSSTRAALPAPPPTPRRRPPTRPPPPTTPRPTSPRRRGRRPGRRHPAAEADAPAADTDTDTEPADASADTAQES